MRAIVQLARADFLERVRRYSFLITLGIVVWAAYMLLPPNHAKYTTMSIDGYRGVYNSAFVGAIIAMMGSIYLGLAGFYLVKNAIRRDRITGVGEIIAATPASRLSYTVGKMFSNLAVLGAIIVVLMIASGVTQVLRGEETHLQLWALVSPFLLIAVPVASLVAGMAVLFESVRFLRGGLGNVIYYGVWTTSLALEFEAGSPIYGNNAVLAQIKTACVAAVPGVTINPARSSNGLIFKDGALWDLKTFVWNGIDWTNHLLTERAVIFLIGISLAVVAAIFFDRFDTTMKIAKAPPEKLPARKDGWQERWRRRLEFGLSPDDETPAAAPAGAIADVDRTIRSRYPALIRAELKLLLRRHGIWWRLSALALIVLCAAVPIGVGRDFIWPLAWLWPILVWSSLGTREKRFRTIPILFSTPHPLMRQLTATWVSGVFVTALVTSGMALSLILHGEMTTLVAWLMGVVFVPSLALLMGVLTGNGKFFEILYMLLWYGGPMNHVPPLDYAATLNDGSSLTIASWYLAIGIGLFVLAVLARWRGART